MDQEQIQACREWIARRTAELDQREKRFEAGYDLRSPRINLMMMNDLEAALFWVDIHRWELGQMIQTEIDEYPQPSKND